MIQILLYPCAKLLEKLLPDWGLTIAGTRHSLNPGPWTFREQMFATITYNIAIYTTNSYGMILVQRSPVYYGQTYITSGYMMLLTLFVQLMGMGFAGYLRRFSVYPVKALWPTILPIIAMNRTLTRPETRENISGWTISRYKFFYVVTISMFFYYVSHFGSDVNSIWIPRRETNFTFAVVARLPVQGTLDIQLDDLDFPDQRDAGDTYRIIVGFRLVQSNHHF